MIKVIEIEPTPNPNALKFFVDKELAASGVKQFDSHKTGNKDPLAKPLFKIGGVVSVFYTGNFITVAKADDILWKDLEPKVVDVLRKCDPPKSAEKTPTPKRAEAPESDDPLLKEINKVLDENVRPALVRDGGGLEVISLDGYMLTIHYQGACGSCPSATQGTMMAVQNLLRAMVDPRIQVVSNQPSQ